MFIPCIERASKNPDPLLHFRLSTTVATIYGTHYRHYNLPLLALAFLWNA